jgi:L-alanine-DL-glutamate epimerase-like enolase superfamily enzyme
VKITAIVITSGVLQLKTDEGLTGIASIRPEAQLQAQALASEVLFGEDPRGAVGLWQRMVDACSPSGATGLALQTLSALDVAVWDLKSKANQEPLWRTLGGLAPRLNTHFSFQNGPSDLALVRALGFRGGKLTLGEDLSADLRMLTGIREALQANSNQPALMIDANERWSPKEAIRALRQIEEQFDITWVEEPVPRWDFLGLKRIADSIRAAVCSSERLSVINEYLPHLSHGAANIVQINLAYGGITGAMQLADAAFGFELPVVLSAATGNIHAHVGAAIPYCASIEIAEPVLAGDTLTTAVRIEDGWACAGDRHGHGLQLSGPST